MLRKAQAYDPIEWCEIAERLASRNLGHLDYHYEDVEIIDGYLQNVEMRIRELLNVDGNKGGEFLWELEGMDQDALNHLKWEKLHKIDALESPSGDAGELERILRRKKVQSQDAEAVRKLNDKGELMAVGLLHPEQKEVFDRMIDIIVHTRELSARLQNIIIAAQPGIANIQNERMELSLTHTKIDARAIKMQYSLPIPIKFHEKKLLKASYR